MFKLDELFRDKVIFDNLYFLNSFDLGFKSKVFCLEFLVDILPLEGSENVADPTDPDPKHRIL